MNVYGSVVSGFREGGVIVAKIVRLFPGHLDSRIGQWCSLGAREGTTQPFGRKVEFSS